MELKCPKDPKHELQKYAAGASTRRWCLECRVSYHENELADVDRQDSPGSYPAPLNGSRNLSKPEPPPKRSIQPAVWDLVMMDMDARDKSGEKKYGTRLQPHNGRDALVDAYQEGLDLVVYLRQAIYERDGM